MTILEIAERLKASALKKQVVVRQGILEPENRAVFDVEETETEIILHIVVK